MNETIKYLAENYIFIISNIVFFWLWCAFLDIVLERRYSLWVNVLAHAVGTVLYFISVILPYLSTISFLLLLFVLSAQAIILYKDKLIRKLLAVVIDFLTLLIAELVNLSVFPFLESLDGGVKILPPSQQIASYSIYFFVNIAVLLTAAVIFKKSGGKRKYPLSYGLVVLIPFAVEIFLIYSWVKAVLGDDLAQTGFLIIVIFLCVIGNSALFITIRTMQSRSDLKAENRSLETMVKTQEEYYSALTEQYENVRKMRHDIANHIYTINILLEYGKGDEAAEYTKELSERQHYSSSLGNCENHVLDAFLHHRIEELCEKGIETDVRINLRLNTDISNCDLISVFGNLLDNAAEACANAGEAKISIVSELRGNYLFVSVENPMPDSTEAKKRRIPELERGLGTKILQNLAEKYDGELKCEAADGIYSATILLKAFTNDTVKA